jgi:hypothetical protein
MHHSVLKTMIKSLKAFIDEAFNVILSVLDDTDTGKPAFIFTAVKFNGITIKGKINMFTLREGQEIELTAEPLTEGGNAAAYQVGTAVWDVQPAGVAEITVNPTNELKATLRGTDGSNNTPIVVSLHADGDPDEGVTDIVGVASGAVTQGKATVFSLKVGAPTDVPPAATDAGTADTGSAVESNQ